MYVAYKHTLVLVFKPQFITVLSNNLIHNLQIKMNNNLKDLVIRAFQKMDIWLLDDLLPDTIYQDATKTKFLEKIDFSLI